MLETTSSNGCSAITSSRRCGLRKCEPSLSEQPAWTLGCEFLKVEKYLLATQTAGVAGEPAVGADDPVARNQNRQWIASHRRPDNLRRRTVVELTGQLSVRARLTVWDLADQIPHSSLQLISARIKLDVELLALPGEVLSKLSAHAIESAFGSIAKGRRIRPVPVMGEVQPNHHLCLCHHR